MRETAAPAPSKSNLKLEVEVESAAPSCCIIWPPIHSTRLDSTRLDSIAVVLFIISLARGRPVGRPDTGGSSDWRDSKQAKQTDRILKDAVRPGRSIRGTELILGMME